MVNKITIVRIVLIIVLICSFVVIFAVDESNLSSHQPDRNNQIILQMQMIPVDGSPGEFILEYSNGQRELLKKDGTRVLLKPIKVSN